MISTILSAEGAFGAGVQTLSSERTVVRVVVSCMHFLFTKQTEKMFEISVTFFLHNYVFDSAAITNKKCEGVKREQPTYFVRRC